MAKKLGGSRSERVWMRVMREGRSPQQIAAEMDIALTRVERILFAVGRRRVALHAEAEQASYREQVW
jgi:DNA-directed RNA polymerase specialized sigma24 family protein